MDSSTTVICPVARDLSNAGISAVKIAVIEVETTSRIIDIYDED